MRANITTLMLVTMLFLERTATAQTEKTLAKSFHPQNHTTIVLNVADRAEIREWDHPMVRIQMKINLSHSNEAHLKALVEAGRYHLSTVLEAQAIQVAAPQLTAPLQLTNGSQETISYIVFVPRNMVVKIDTDVTKKWMARLEP